MIELGKRDFLAHGTLSMDLFRGNRSFIGVDMLGLMTERRSLAKRYVFLTLLESVDDR